MGRVFIKNQLPAMINREERAGAQPSVTPTSRPKNNNQTCKEKRYCALVANYIRHVCAHSRDGAVAAHLPDFTRSRLSRRTETAVHSCQRQTEKSPPTGKTFRRSIIFPNIAYTSYVGCFRKNSLFKTRLHEYITSFFKSENCAPHGAHSGFFKKNHRSPSYGEIFRQF